MAGIVDGIKARWTEFEGHHPVAVPRMKNAAKVAGVAVVALALTAAIFATLMHFNVVSAGAPFTLLSNLTPFGTGVALTATATLALTLLYKNRDTIKDKLTCCGGAGDGGEEAAYGAGGGGGLCGSSSTSGVE